jgi:hypothetical protein
VLRDLFVDIPNFNFLERRDAERILGGRSETIRDEDEKRWAECTVRTWIAKFNDFRRRNGDWIASGVFLENANIGIVNFLLQSLAKALHDRLVEIRDAHAVARLAPPENFSKSGGKDFFDGSFEVTVRENV